MAIRLSKSKLDDFVSCPRCFWLETNHKLKQPDMISSKVWKGIERVTTEHYESHRRTRTTPPNLIGQVLEGTIPYQGDRIDMKSLRYWGKGLRFMVDGVEVSTALDDMLERPVATAKGGRLFNVVDYKSKSKPTDEDSTRDLYQNQADVFDLACNVNDYPTDGKVYFDYWSPLSVDAAAPAEAGLDMGQTKQTWLSQVIVLRADHDRIKKLILAAAACLESRIPEPKLKVGKTPGCPVCVYAHDRETLMSVLTPKVAA